MRRAVAISSALLVCTLAGCSTALLNDRYAGVRSDPFLWWLSGAPQPYDLNWPRTYPPDLPVLNPAEYTAMPPPRPLDVPRGWNPDYPPYIGTGNDNGAASDPATPPASGPGCAACETPATAADAARAGVRAGTGDGERARQY